MITKIIIKGTSGYGPISESYKDKLVVTADNISYEYIPYQESIANTSHKWRYKTNSPLFRHLFLQAAEIIPAVLTVNAPPVSDIGKTTFIVSYDNGSREKREFFLPGQYFGDIFKILKQMVPGCEYEPAVLSYGSKHVNN